MSEPTLPLGERHDRRSFLKIAGVGGAVLVTAGCDSDDPDPITPGTFSMLSGTVTVDTAADPAGSPVAGVTVIATSTDSGIAGNRTTVTDAGGMYSFEDLPVGTYTITVMTTNFVTKGVMEEDVTVTESTTAVANFSLVPGGDIELDFSSDIGVLNYAYALEQLEAAFYDAVINDPDFATTFPDAGEQEILSDLAAHEAIHRDFFEAAIIGAGGTFAARTLLPGLTPDFDGKEAMDGMPPVAAIDFTDRDAVLAQALVFEDLGVGAYNGAGEYLNRSTSAESDDYLTLAGKIVSVEARHASVIAGLITPNALAGETAEGDPVIDPATGLDQALSPEEVLEAAGDFLENKVSAINT